MINIVKLLKNAPNGMKLYSPLFGEVKFKYINSSKFEIVVEDSEGCYRSFDKYGRYFTIYNNAECLLFPSKDCRTWEGWKLPVKPNFKVGDWITDGNITIQIEDVRNDCYTYSDGVLYSTKTADEVYHLWTIQDAKDGDVLVNDAGCIFINAGFEKDDKVTLACYCYVSVQGIFYEEDHKTGSWLYVSHVHPATKEQRDLLFKKMKEAGYEWDEKKKELRKIKPHYDIANFKPFDKVLVRDRNDESWRIAFYGYYNEEAHYSHFVGTCWSKQCIPFNEETKHLLGTTDMPSDEFINW